MPYSEAVKADPIASWSWRRVWALCRKEWADLYRNRRILFLTFFLPLTLLILPIIGLWTVSMASEAELAAEAPVLLEPLGQGGLGTREQVQALLTTQFLTLFLLAPLTIPVSTAAYSVVGEKRERSLEPLLATPLHTGELIAGKALGAVLPGVGATVVAYGLYAVVARQFIENDEVYRLVLGPLPLLVIGVLGPLLSLLGVLLTLVVSSRSTDPRAAEQVSLTLVLPLIALFVLQVFGLLRLHYLVVLASTLGLVVLNGLAIALAVRVFARGNILSRL